MAGAQAAEGEGAHGGVELVDHLQFAPGRSLAQQVDQYGFRSGGCIVEQSGHRQEPRRIWETAWLKMQRPDLF
jgi:hypothetical protein